MIKELVYLFVVYIIVVNGQNIFFDCRKEIINGVIRNDFEKTEVFLETGQNGLALENLVSQEITEQTRLNSNSFWRLNASVNKITINFTQFNTGGSYYVITGISINNINATQCQFENIIKSNSYKLTYKVDGSLYEVNWFGSSELSSYSPLLRANINPITVQELFIERNIIGAYEYCVQYEIYGCPIGTNSGTLTTVPVLEYNLSSEPITYTNREFTGVCREGKCYGGVGTMSNGVIGEITSINLSKQTLFTIWEGISSLEVSFKLSNYFYITTVRVYFVLLPANAFDPFGELINPQNYSISTNTIDINNIVQIIDISIQSNSNGYLAITEIVILGKNNKNIQDYYKMPYQPMVCDDVTQTTTTTFLTERKELEYFILIVTVGVLGMLLLLMVLVIILLVCGIIVISRSRNISQERIENAIKSNIHANTMSLAENRIAIYSDVNATEMNDFRERIRSRALSDEYLEMEKLVENGLTSSDKLFCNETDDQVFSKLFKQEEFNDKGSTVKKDKFPDESNHYDEICRSTN